MNEEKIAVAVIGIITSLLLLPSGVIGLGLLFTASLVNKVLPKQES